MALIFQRLARNFIKNGYFPTDGRPRAASSPYHARLRAVLTNRFAAEG